MNRSVAVVLCFCLGMIWVGCSPAAPSPESVIDLIVATAEADVAEILEAESSSFVLTSSVLTPDGPFPVNFACDGLGISPPLMWEGAPVGTHSYALLFDVLLPSGDYDAHWIVYNMSASVSEIEIGATETGILGMNSLNEELAYAPPCPETDGEQVYTFHLYALAGAVRFDDPATAGREMVLDTIDHLVLGEATLAVTFDRSEPVEVEIVDPSTLLNNDICDGGGAFNNYIRLRVRCFDEEVYIESDLGLPTHEMMAGITAPTMNLPLPFGYVGRNAWRIAREPIWLDSYEATHARGPLAVAVNGVPIYHYENRSRINLGESYRYDPQYDSILVGDLDRCGGHAGEGDDYHYHGPPVCLLENHDLRQPIAYTFGGAAIYFGTGGTDYYGDGLYNEIDNLPETELDKCNAVQLEDGSYVYYTTDTPPYVLGCHHEAVDWTFPVKPEVGREVSEFGDDVVEILSWEEDEDQQVVMLVLTDEGEEQALVYRPSILGIDCWDIEFRVDPAVPVGAINYCRPDQEE